MVRLPDDAELVPGRFTSAASRPSAPARTEPVDIRPCPGCDGWLVERGVEYRTTDDGPEPVAIRWGCRTCGRVERTDLED